jgi:hypothetical protein
MKEEYDLRGLTSKLTKAFPQIEGLDLFGSRRYRTGSPRSDVDILVELQPEAHIRPQELRAFSAEHCRALDLCGRGRPALAGLTLHSGHLRARHLSRHSASYNRLLALDGSGGGVVRNGRIQVRSLLTGRARVCQVWLPPGWQFNRPRELRDLVSK